MIRRQLPLLIFTIAFGISAGAQTVTAADPAAQALTALDSEVLTANRASIYLGFQSAASPQLSGGSRYCHRNPDVTILGLTLPSYLCGSTIYSGQVTTGTAGIDVVWLARKSFLAGSSTSAGAAVNQNGTGGAYDFGAWAEVNVAKLLKIDGLWVRAAAGWNKQNVSAALQASTGSTLKDQIPVLRQIAATTGWSFGFTKAWGK